MRNLYSAITHKTPDSGDLPAHFDCVLKNLRETNELARKERICYLGGGSFGIVKLPDPNSRSRFSIRERIQYEEKEQVPAWRRGLPLKNNVTSL